MSYPETVESHQQTVHIATLGELALAPKPPLIEVVDPGKEHEPLALITRQSFVTHQNTSDDIHSSRVAFYAWKSLSSCVQGTMDAQARAAYHPEAQTPDFTNAAIVGMYYKKQKLFGYHPEMFCDVAQTAVEQQKHIPNLGDTQVVFLQSLARAITQELGFSEEPT